MVYASTRSPVAPYRGGAEREGSPSATGSTNQRSKPVKRCPAVGIRPGGPARNPVMVYSTQVAMMLPNVNSNEGRARVTG